MISFFTGLLFLGLLHSAHGVPARCPEGWQGIPDVSTGAVRCFSFFRQAQIPMDVDFFCRSVVNTSGSRAVSLHSEYESAFVRSLAVPCVDVALGGAWTLSERAWFDGSPMDFVAPNDGSDGCLAMHCDGSWFAVPCSERPLPFVCAVTVVPTPTTPPPAPSSTGTTPPSTQSPAPIAPRPAPSSSTCPDLWQFLNATGKCYRAFPNLYSTAQDAESNCRAYHPKAHLTSVFDATENAFVASLVVGTSLFAGAVFMSEGSVGVWYEDSAFFDAAAFERTRPSSPGWPTAANRYYSNWAQGEPSDYGCLRISTATGEWSSTSCQVPRPYVCSFINDGTTFPPVSVQTTVPPSTTPQSPMERNVSCPAGWIGIRRTRKCYTVYKESTTPFRGDNVCRLRTPDVPSSALHTTSVTGDDESVVLSRLMQIAGVPSAVIGATVIAYGADGMFTDGLTEWDPAAAFIASQWAAGEPSLESGCVSLGVDRTWRTTSCQVATVGVACSFDADTPIGPNPPPSTTPQTTLPDVPPQRRLLSIDGKTTLRLLMDAQGIYSVASRGGSLEGYLLMFSADGSCNTPTSEDAIATIFRSRIDISFVYPVANGTVCVSENGFLYYRTEIRFSVMDVSVRQLRLLEAPSTRYDLTGSSMASIPITRRTTGNMAVAGRNPQWITSMRLASSTDCTSPAYVYGGSVLATVNGVAQYQLIDVEPFSLQFLAPFGDEREFHPPVRFVVCVSLTNGSFMSLPARVLLPPSRVVLNGFVSPSGAVVPEVTILQYSTPKLRISGAGMTPSMMFFFTLGSSCTRSSGGLYRFAPIYIDSVGEGTPYIIITLNHTRLDGIPIGVDRVQYRLCLADSSFETPEQTPLRVTVVTQMLKEINIADTSPQNSSVLNLNVGFSGILTLKGLQRTDLSLETISTIRLAFAPIADGSSPIPLAQQCQNQQSFYQRQSLPLISTTILNVSDTDVDFGVIIPPTFFNQSVARRLRACISVVHAQDFAGRSFVPTFAFVDIRAVSLLFIGDTSANTSTGIASTVVVPENSEHVLIPLVGYGVKPDMIIFASQTSCFIKDEPAESFMARSSLMNFSVYDLYDVPREYRQSLTTKENRMFLVLTKKDHTSTAMAKAVFEEARSGVRRPLWLCLFASGIEKGVIPLPFTFVVRRPFISSIYVSSNASTRTITYSSRVDLTVAGFGIERRTTVLIPGLDCSKPETFLWKAPVPLFSVPVAVPLGDAPFERLYNPTGIRSFFLSLDVQQTARIGSLDRLTQRPQRFWFCAAFDDPQVFENTTISFEMAIPTLSSFSVDGGAPDATLFLKKADPSGSDFVDIFAQGSLLEKLEFVDDTFYMYFAGSGESCESIGVGRGVPPVDRFVTIHKGMGIIAPAQVPEVGPYKVCFTTVLPSATSNASGQNALRLVEARQLKAVVSMPTFSLFTVNGSTQLSIYARQEWILPIDGVGISNRTTLRLATSTSCDAVVDNPDIPVHISFSQVLYFGRLSAYYIFIPTETTRTLAAGRYYVCMRPTLSRPWVRTDVVVNLLPRLRRPTWFRYFDDDTKGNVSAVRVQFPTKVVESSGELTIMAAIGAETSILMRCGPQLCPDRARVLLSKVTDATMEDPCFVDEYDISGEYTQGPFVLHNGILTLTSETSRTLSAMMRADTNWTFCVETAPTFYRQPMRPRLRLAFSSPVITGVSRRPDTVDNSSAFSPANKKSYALYAGDATTVLYLNGVGLLSGTLVALSPNCSDPKAAASMRNPALALPRKTVDNRGAIIIASTEIASVESSPLQLCLVSQGPALNSSVRSGIVLSVEAPNRHVEDLLGFVGDTHTIESALRDTIFLPQLSRGIVDLNRLRLRNGNTFPWTADSEVLFSASCLYNSEGTAVTQVSARLQVAITRNHTTRATAGPLHVCIRRRVLFGVGQRQWWGFETSTFQPTGFKLLVAAVELTSVSRHAMNPLTSDSDVRLVIAKRAGEDLLLRMRFTEPSPPATATQPLPSSVSLRDQYYDGILRRIGNPAAISFFDLARFASGKPCSDVHRSEQASLRSIGEQRAQFRIDGTVITRSDARSGEYFAALPAALGGNSPFESESLCMSLDQGATFMSVGVAVFGVTWASTLAVVRPAKKGSPFVNNIEVYENTQISVAVADTRYNSRVTASRDAITVALGSFAEAVLWNGFINNVGFVRQQQLMLVAAYAGDPIDGPLSFSTDNMHTGIRTGITLRLLPMRFRCGEEGLLLHRLEPGTTFTATPHVCAFGLNDGSYVRYAPRCSAANVSYVGEGIVVNGRVSAPAITPYLAEQTLSVCIKQFVNPSTAMALGREAVFIDTNVRVSIGHVVAVTSINGLSKGTLIVYQNEPVDLSVVGSGIGEGNVLLTFVPWREGCAAASQRRSLGGMDQLSSWFVVRDDYVALTEVHTANVLPIPALQRVICYSLDGGVTFSSIGSPQEPLMFAVVPATVTGFVQVYDPVLSTSNAVATLRVAQSSVQPVPGPYLPTLPPLVVLNDNTDMFAAGNGISRGSRRSIPLLGALFPASQFSTCNGRMPSSPAAQLRIDSRTGEVIDLNKTTIDMSQPYLLCTSSDLGATFYSANGAFITGVSSVADNDLFVDLEDTDDNPTYNAEEYRRQVVLVRFDPTRGGTDSAGDTSLVLDVALTKNNPIAALNLDGIQEAVASVLGVPPTFVAVSASSSRTLDNTSMSCVLVAVTLRAPVQNVSTLTGYPVLISLLNSPEEWAAEKRSELISSFLDNGTQVGLPAAVLESSLVFSSGNIVGGKLHGETTVLAVTHLREYVPPQTMEKKSTWSSIPILLLFPIFLAFATYFIYNRFFLIDGDKSDLPASPGNFH